MEGEYYHSCFVPQRRHGIKTSLNPTQQKLVPWWLRPLGCHERDSTSYIELQMGFYWARTLSPRDSLEPPPPPGAHGDTKMPPIASCIVGGVGGGGTHALVYTTQECHVQRESNRSNLHFCRLTAMFSKETMAPLLETHSYKPIPKSLDIDLLIILVAFAVISSSC